MVRATGKSLVVIAALMAAGLGGVLKAEELLLIEPMSAEQMDEASGRQGLSLQWQLNENEQNGLVSGNVLSGPSVTGNNLIADHAFQNMSGIATVIQNTGNQVVIQDSTQVNILINR